MCNPDIFCKEHRERNLTHYPFTSEQVSRYIESLGGLVPCSKCGKKAKVVYFDNSPLWIIGCEDCNRKVQGVCDDLPSLVALWNVNEREAKNRHQCIHNPPPPTRASPCICGGTDIRYWVKTPQVEQGATSVEPTKFYVGCSSCGFDHFSIVSMEGAIAEWNKGVGEKEADFDNILSCMEKMRNYAEGVRCKCGSDLIVKKAFLARNEFKCLTCGHTWIIMTPGWSIRNPGWDIKTLGE